ncbi:protein suppressor of variegation 3-7, partial [Cydia splendana]
KRWKHLRDHYMKKKKAASGTGQAKNDNNTWEYMSQLTFLSQAPSQRHTLTNVESEVQISEEQNESICEENTPQNTSQDSVYLDLDKNMSVDSPQNTDDSFVEPTVKKRKKTNDLVSLLKHRQDERARVFDKLLSDPKKSPIHKFFESMADIVCELPPHLIAEARLKVCQMVNELEIKNSQSLSLTPMPSSYDSSDSWPY